ncbi:MAG: chemotaxis protein CheW [Pirellulales bacterium]|nr:chemotaxis protein CheW [Pirellulales bacterium]
MSELEFITREFLLESCENLDQLDRDLVMLEQDPQNQEYLAGIFRTIHTIKGSCGFLGFGKLESVTHAGESLLSKLRDGELQLQAETTTGLLSLVDAVREMLANIEVAGSEGSQDYAGLIETLMRLQAGKSDCDARAGNSSSSGGALATEDCGAGHNGGGSLSDEDARANRVTIGEAAPGGVSDSTIRVDAGLLDKLMNRVGELVLARNQILQSSSMASDAELLSTAQRLNLITTELQEGVMKTRMQPIGNIWGKFPRLVRDLALQCGKQVQIELEGKETELDKTIVEAIKDPLTHLVRNAVDHGIETPAMRLARGKPAEGRLVLRAFHEGGQVNIEITDDGAGLDVERISQKAIENGLLTHDQILRMNDREVAQLIFAPGFSTAAAVSNVSGRGVGMDVVKTNVEKIGGTVDVQSVPGNGTTIKIKIPLTLAIIPALIVTCDGDRFAIPQVSLLELVRLEEEQARSGIERLHGAPVYRLRGHLLPIVDLRRELELPPRAAAGPADLNNNVVVNIVVLRADDRQFGLVVDAINDTEEIVVKPLGKQLKGITVFAGATIMGDGKVALILDVLGMAQRAHVVAEDRERSLVDQATRPTEQHRDLRTLVILAVGDRRLAIDIALVSRLEEIARADIEGADDRDVVQYRGQIMPLLHVGKLLGIPHADAQVDRPLQVIVHSQRDRSVGLVVDRIIDIVQTTVEVTRPANNDNLLASAVIQQRVTDLVDVPSLIRRADPMFYEASVEEAVVA